MEFLRVALGHGRSAEVGVVGPAGGRPVLYFHSPATSGEEMAGAAAALDRRPLSIRRPSVACADPDEFIDAVATDTEAVTEKLDVDRPVVLGWSGGAPYALAAAVRLGPRIDCVHLVSPVPGPLSGPDAVPDPTERLREIAGSTSASPWISGPSALRDYHAVAAPWPFAIESVVQNVTSWSPIDDEIVPPHLVQRLALRLPSATVVETTGTHAWLTDNWSTVLGRT